MFKWDKENFSQLSKFLDRSWRNLGTFSVKLWFLVKDWGIIGASLKIFPKCWVKIELKGTSFFKQGMQNQLISEDWRFLHVFLSRLLQAIWIHLLHRSQQITLCLLATAFWHMRYGNLIIVVVMLWSKISSGDRMGIVVSAFITRF